LDKCVLKWKFVYSFGKRAKKKIIFLRIEENNSDS